MNKDEELERLFGEDSDAEPEPDPALMQQVLKQTRKAASRRDTMDLVFVKIWAAMAVLLAPLFAKGASSQMGRPKDVKRSTSDSDRPAN